MRADLILAGRREPRRDSDLEGSFPGEREGGTEGGREEEGGREGGGGREREREGEGESQRQGAWVGRVGAR